MPESTVTSKGQITIPKEVRDQLRIGAGDRVSFLVREDGVVELRPATVDLRDLFGILEHTGPALGIAEMDEVIRDAVNDASQRDPAR